MAVVRKLLAEVEHVIEHADDVRSYVLKPDGRTPRFKPGQFLHLAIDPYDPSHDWPDSRVFSIASAPKSDRIRVTVSKKGRFTGRIFSELTTGSNVWLKLPYGEFSFKNEADPLVLIAGGTGIAPFVSFLEQSLLDGHGPSTALHYGVRTPAHAIFEDVLDQCKRELSNFDMTTWVEEGDNLCGERGRLDIEKIHQKHGGESTIFYLSGPWEMIDAFRNRLAELGVAVDKIRIDAWE
jgi:ferredoxin-NADP reductase